MHDQIRNFNPFTAPACKISRLKDARTRLQTYIFRSSGTSTFIAMRFDKNPLTHHCEKEDKMVEGFQISHFYWLFSSDIMAVKGLIVTWPFVLRSLTSAVHLGVEYTRNLPDPWHRKKNLHWTMNSTSFPVLRAILSGKCPSEKARNNSVQHRLTQISQGPKVAALMPHRHAALQKGCE